MSNINNKEFETSDGAKKFKFILLTFLFLFLYVVFINIISYVFEEYILRGLTGGYTSSSFGLGPNNVARSIRFVATVFTGLGIFVIPFIIWKKFFREYGENIRPANEPRR